MALDPIQVINSQLAANELVLKVVVSAIAKIANGTEGMHKVIDDSVRAIVFTGGNPESNEEMRAVVHAKAREIIQQGIDLAS